APPGAAPAAPRGPVRHMSTPTTIAQTRSANAREGAHGHRGGREARGRLQRAAGDRAHPAEQREPAEPGRMSGAREDRDAEDDEREAGRQAAAQRSTIAFRARPYSCPPGGSRAGGVGVIEELDVAGGL